MKIGGKSREPSEFPRRWPGGVNVGATKKEPPRNLESEEPNPSFNEGECTCELYGIAGCWTCTNLNDERTR